MGSFVALSGDQIAWVTWTSDDGGATWAEDRDGPSPFPLEAITAGGSGFVGAGRDYVTGAEFNSWIALSAEGINWERLPVTLEGRISSLTIINERIVAVGGPTRRWLWG